MALEKNTLFTGFTDETVDFLWGIRFNNEKSWFEAHKEIYKTQLYQPLSALAGELYEFLAEKRPHANLVSKVTRIYRDARRIHSGGPYKESHWLSVEPASEDWTDKPTFFFEISPDGYCYGLGDWAPPVTMAKLRARMDRDPKPMEKLTRSLRRRTEFVLEQPEYKRPKGTAPSPVLEPWYRAKSIDIIHRDKLTEELFSRAIVDRLKEGCEFLLPWFDYLSTLSGDPAPEEKK